MRMFLSILSAVVVIALAYWAYQENFRTQQSLKDVSDLQTRIAEQSDRLAMLRAEWAYLNRPDRLRDLADLNYDRLGLMPLDPGQFGLIEQVRYRRIDPAELRGTVDVSSGGGPLGSYLNRLDLHRGIQ